MYILKSVNYNIFNFTNIQTKLLKSKQIIKGILNRIFLIIKKKIKNEIFRCENVIKEPYLKEPILSNLLNV